MGLTGPVTVHPRLLADLEGRQGKRGPWDAAALAAVKGVVVTDGEGPLVGLEHLPNLVSLRIHRWDRPALPPLVGFPRLTGFALDDTDATSLGFLEGHPRLFNVTVTQALVQDLSPLATLPNLGSLVLDALPLDERSYREIVPQLKARGVAVHAFDRHFPEHAFRRLRRLADRGIGVVGLVDDAGELRMFAPGRHHRVVDLFVLTDAQFDALLDDPALDTAAFVARGRTLFLGR